MIEPNKGAYGPEADASNLADWLELLALAGTPLRRAELADYLRDSGWVVRSRELYHSPTVDEPDEDDVDGGAEIDPAEEHSAIVFAIAEQRAAELKALWPFRLDDVAVVAEEIADHHRPYLCLLALTVAHHYAVATEAMPENVFEAIVASALRARGLETCDFGATWRAAGNFRDAVRAAGDQIRVDSAPEGAVSREAANDEGVDTIGHLSWGDTRPGHWLFIGQVTVGRSNTWQAKIKQPQPPQWEKLLGSYIRPAAFLAVPHHVEEVHLQAITEGTSRLVVDRLRLCRYVADIGDDCQQVLAAVLASETFDPRI